MTSHGLTTSSWRRLTEGGSRRRCVRALRVATLDLSADKEQCVRGSRATSARVAIRECVGIHSYSPSREGRPRRRRMLTRPNVPTSIHTNAHTGPRPKPQCHCVRILREQRKPAISYPCRWPCPLRSRLCLATTCPSRPVRQRGPISTSNEKKKNRSAKRKTRLPQENGRRQIQRARHHHLTFICLQVEPRTRSTWHCYTRRSSCGLTTGSISDRRKVNFPKTFYTPLTFPRIFLLRSATAHTTTHTFTQTHTYTTTHTNTHTLTHPHTQTMSARFSTTPTTAPAPHLSSSSSAAPPRHETIFLPWDVNPFTHFRDASNGRRLTDAERGFTSSRFVGQRLPSRIPTPGFRRTSSAIEADLRREARWQARHPPARYARELPLRQEP